MSPYMLNPKALRDSILNPVTGLRAAAKQQVRYSVSNHDGDGAAVAVMVFTVAVAEAPVAMRLATTVVVW